jgi:aldehyde:ferredoxin oxidoreductase
MEYYGYAGRILKVDLSTGSIKTEKLDMDIAKKFLGGQGVNTRLLLDLLKPKLNPLSPENVIVFGAGPLCGTPAPSAAKFSATTKFPENGAIGTANGCGRFGPMLKWAGYDHIVVTGASEKPVYLSIMDDDVELCDASDLWGKDILESTEMLYKRHGHESSVLCIGPAGERLVRMSLALIDGIGHIGRGGLGAVMGSKKLKAMAVRGSKGIRLADVEMFWKIFDFVVNRAFGDRNRPRWIKYGLQGVTEAWLEGGVVPIKNRRESPPAKEAIKKFGLKAWDEVLECYPWAGVSCITCDKLAMKIKKGKFEGLQTLASTTNNPITFLGLPFDMSLGEAVKCHDIFNRYGIDIINGSYIIEVLIDLYEKGLVTEEQLKMIPRPNFETVVKAIEMILKREGLWDVIADGILALISKIPESSKYIIHNKGLAFPFDGRVCLGVEVFGMLTNPRGAQSFALVRTPSLAIPNIPIEMVKVLAATYQIPMDARRRIFKDGTWSTARFTPYVENSNTALNCLGLCYRFYISRIYNPVVASAMYVAVTGIPLSPEEFLTAGERVWNLQKVLNVREGFDRKDDAFPERWITEPLKFGEKELRLQDYCRTLTISTREEAEKLLDEYYEERGWDVKRGIPTKEKLTKLGIPEAAALLEL